MLEMDTQDYVVIAEQETRRNKIKRAEYAVIWHTQPLLFLIYSITHAPYKMYQYLFCVVIYDETCKEM